MSLAAAKQAQEGYGVLALFSNESAQVHLSLDLSRGFVELLVILFPGLGLEAEAVERITDAFYTLGAP